MLRALNIRRLEGDLEALGARFRIAERDLPVMLAFVDTEERYRFHKEACRRWLGLNAEQIDGRIMRKVLGKSVYAGIADRVRRALSETCVRYNHTHARGAGTREICVHLVPTFDERRAVAGFCSLQVDPLVMAGAESAAADTVQNDDFHLGGVW